MFEGKIRRRELILELQHADVVLAIKEKKDKEREGDLMLIHRLVRWSDRIHFIKCGISIKLSSPLPL